MSSFMDTRPRRERQLDAVANETRRRLLVTLLDESPPGDTPIEIVEWVNESESTESLTAMQHTHLPKLDDQGWIRWGRETGRVSQGPQFTEIEPLLKVLNEHWDELPDG